MNNDYRELIDAIDKAEVVDVCRDLVRFETVNPPGDEKSAAEYVARYLRDEGFETRLLVHSESRATAIARLKGTGNAPAIMFNGHLDVVPAGTEGWSHKPFGAEVSDGRVWGRGTADMKGGLAAMLVAAKTLARARIPLLGDLVITATAGEEIHMLGARECVAVGDLGPIQAILIAEPTANEVGIAERGVLWLELTTHGKTAHGSTPHLGRNAIMMMLAFLNGLATLDIPFRRHPVLGDMTRSINTIVGGVKTNVVPDRCVATVDFRTVPGQDHEELRARVEALAASLQGTQPQFSGSVGVEMDLPAVETDPASPVVQRFVDIVAQVTGTRPEPGPVPFATEAAIFVPALNVPAISFGPGEPGMAHKPDEYVDIRKMTDAAAVFAVAAAEMLGSGE